MVDDSHLAARQVHHVGVALAAVHDDDAVVVGELVLFPVVDGDVQNGDHADQGVSLQLSLVDDLRMDVPGFQKLLQCEGGRDGVGVGEVVGLDKDPTVLLFQQFYKLIRKNSVLPRAYPLDLLCYSIKI